MAAGHIESRPQTSIVCRHVDPPSNAVRLRRPNVTR
jgi:hypothetical protein